MSYEILVERTAERDLARLSNDLHDRIIGEIRKLAENPRPVGCRKLAGRVNNWRIRVGDYRVIYEVTDRNHVVRIVRVRHRGEAYRL